MCSDLQMGEGEGRKEEERRGIGEGKEGERRMGRRGRGEGKEGEGRGEGGRSREGLKL